jgi:predicted Zn-dependent protease with MMP-like domain
LAHPVREHFRTLRTIEDNNPSAPPTRVGTPCGFRVLARLTRLGFVSTTRGYRERHRRRPNRDRHGRGLRGSLYPSTLPAPSTRAERFDALVLGALEPIEARWRTELTELDIAVDDVPDVRATERPEDAQEGLLADAGVPLARLVPAGMDRRGQPTKARIVLFRRPLEARARDGADLADLVHHVLVEQVATYLNLDPGVIEGE